MEKAKAAEYFGVSGSNIKHFRTVTPENGYELEGWINKTRGTNLGSLIINTVDGVQTDQFVRGMPKIAYFSKQYTEGLDEPANIIPLHKEDGTNIVAFPLMGKEGTCREVLYKSRGLPNLDKQFHSKVKTLENDKLLKAVSENNLSYSFELYGSMNSHEVNYTLFDIELRMDLLTILDQGKSLPYTDMLDHAKKYGLNPVMRAFTVEWWADENRYHAPLTMPFIDRFEEYLPDVVIPHGCDIYTLYKSMEYYFERLNMTYQDKVKAGIATEGSVWHYGETLNHMLKCKATSVRECHILSACGVPHQDIKKALFKAEENIDSDLAMVPVNIVVDYVKDELGEEYPEKMVQDARTEQKIRATLGKHIRKVEITEEIEQIVERIHQEIDITAAPADKMRVFAQLYPNNKSMGGKVYQAIAGV